MPGQKGHSSQCNSFGNYRLVEINIIVENTKCGGAILRRIFLWKKIHETINGVAPLFRVKGKLEFNKILHCYYLMSKMDELHNIIPHKTFTKRLGDR